MKILISFLLALFFFSSCKKKVEEIQTNLVIEAMTNGQWKMVNFKDGPTDLTADFAPYSFQFKKDLTVDAIKNGSVAKTGTWNANAEAKTITSQFTGAPHPLPFLNGTWKITNNSWTFVEASQEVNGVVRVLRLEKI
jgi:hypothetical protein